MNPINYSVDVQTPFQAALDGYKVGTAMVDIQQKQQQQQAALQAQQQRQALLSRLANNPNATADDYAQVMTALPDIAEHLSKAWTTKNAAQQQSQAADMLQIGAAIKSGKPALAASKLTDRADAIEQQNGGQVTRESQALRTQAQLITDHPEFALGQIQATLAVNPNGKQAAETLASFGNEQRAAARAPADQRKAEADAAAAEADAKTKAVDAAYAEQKAKDEVLKRAAELGLTKAQTNQAVTLTSKYGAETRETLLKLQQIGKPTDAQKFDAEAKLRAEYNIGTKGYVDVTEAYRRLKGSNNDAAGDLSLIFSYMKMLDPGSVVREGEFANAQNAAGVPDRVLNMYNRLLKGERLTDGQRKQFTGQAESLYNSAQKREGEVRAGITKVARNYGLNSENIFGGRASESGASTPNPQRPPIGSFDKDGGG